jgi:hypothetical protein
MITNPYKSGSWFMTLSWPSEERARLMRAYIRAPALCVLSRCATPDTLEIRLQIDLNWQQTFPFAH